MLGSADRMLRDAVDLVKTSQAPHFIFMSFFMSLAAMTEVFESLPVEAAQPKRLTFICLYFGTQPALQSEKDLELISIKKQKAHIVSSPTPAKQQAGRSDHGLSQQLVEQTFFALPALAAAIATGSD